MRTRTRLYAFICLVLLVIVDPASGQEKKRVAVLAFEDGAVTASSAAALGRNQDVGASLADVLVKELIEGGTYSLIERRAIDQVLKEQNFSNSSRVDAKTAVAIGKVLGVQAIITGSVLQFNVEEKEVSVGSGTLGRVTRGVIGGGRRTNATAKVSLTARMIDTTSGEVLTAASGDGESSKSSVGASGYATGTIDMTSSAFQGTVLGEAVRQAAKQVAVTLNEFGSKVAAAPAAYTGLVADVSGRTLIINAGRQKGVRVGDTIEITRPGRQILDPQTKQVLRTIVDTVATARVTEVDDLSATATLNGTATIQVGDQVRRAQ